MLFHTIYGCDKIKVYNASTKLKSLNCLYAVYRVKSHYAMGAKAMVVNTFFNFF